MHPTVKLVLRSFVQHFHLVAGATVACGLLGGCYAFVLKSDVYLASQSLMVRDDASATVMKLGRFESQTQMKAAQETLMELAKNPAVVRKALQDVGPEAKGWFWTDDQYPSDNLVRDIASEAIALHAPTGIEFGNSEVVYLDVKAKTPERAVALNQAIGQRLEERWREVRRLRAESVITELESAKIAAEEQLAQTTEKLREMEQQAGSRLGDLRSLTDVVGGAGGVKTQVDQIEAELRSVKSELLRLQAELQSLDTALANPAAYLLAPVDLLNTQPGLKKLREGLADAQMNTSRLTGRYTERHPLVIAARRAQESIEKQLLDQMFASQQTLRQSIEAANTRLTNLTAQKTETEASLESLATIRADYVNLTSEFKTRSGILEEIERELAQARGSRQASNSESSLLTRLDSPRVGDRPLGPGRAMLTLAAAAAGSMLGIGVVLLLTPLDGTPRFGRRREDAFPPAPPTDERIASLINPPREDLKAIDDLYAHRQRSSSTPTFSARSEPLAENSVEPPLEIDDEQKTRDQLIEELRLDIAAMDCGVTDACSYLPDTADATQFGHVDLHSFDALEAAKQRLVGGDGGERSERR